VALRRTVGSSWLSTWLAACGLRLGIEAVGRWEGTPAREYVGLGLVERQCGMCVAGGGWLPCQYCTSLSGPWAWVRENTVDVFEIPSNVIA